MTKTRLGDFSGVERGYVRDIENGKRKPSVNTVYCMCEALEVDPLEFFRLVERELARLNNRQAE